MMYILSLSDIILKSNKDIEYLTFKPNPSGQVCVKSKRLQNVLVFIPLNFTL